MNRRIATFTVDAEFIRKNPSGVAQVFALLRAVPVRAEMIFANDLIEYTAISERFARVPPGNVIPEVILSVTKVKGKVVGVEISNSPSRVCSPKRQED